MKEMSNCSHTTEIDPDYLFGGEFHILPTRTPGFSTIYQLRPFSPRLITPTVTRTSRPTRESCDTGYVLPTTTETVHRDTRLLVTRMWET